MGLPDNEVDAYLQTELGKKAMSELMLKEVEKMKEVISKYGSNPINIAMVTIAVQATGLGRNKETANTLRAVADLIESNIMTRDTLEAMIKGELH